ncbi:hypothetical protein F5887DRAFT_964521 [Amanita rubescens]|nr:hypothetical protein F5887DRAFT_964521 [Amanita rubescens]
MKVYLIQAKLDSSAVHDLYSLLDTNSNLNLQLSGDPEDADVIITAIRMKRRLERHVAWDTARNKAIVTPDWLRDSVKYGRPASYVTYVALKEQLSASPSRPGSRLPLSIPLDTTSDQVKANYKSRYACCRASPLICPNQALIEELHVLERSRELEGKSTNALSYERAISILKAYPYLITPETYRKEVKNLPHLGEKIRSKVEEFTKNGFIEECKVTRESEEFKALSAFSSIHGVGPVTARNLWDLGLRTIEDMERYYDVKRDDGSAIDEPIYTPNGVLVQRKSKIPEITIKVGLLLREDFAAPIPRGEVEEIYQAVMTELDDIQPGCVSTIVGGYRRGKPLGNDMDIVFSHPDQEHGADIVKGLCQKLVFRMHKRGLVTNVMHLSGFHSHGSLQTGHLDSLEKALTVFKLPDSGDRKRVYRRLDLIFAAPDAYWTAIVGWSGSKMFERDLRLWAKVEKQMKFDSTGLTRRYDSKLFVPKSEMEVFDILGLEWIDPLMRNADV